MNSEIDSFLCHYLTGELINDGFCNAYLILQSD